MNHDQPLRGASDEYQSGGSGPVRAIVKRLRRKLGDEAQNPTYIFTEPRIGYWMPKREGSEQ